ncbi:MAG: DUF2889 domain-containing protein [Piscinibacter sp.]|uniref:DUF2889 domain-containing protein n=1 Tax=Piscinibacter sp. TaxID=1903157 RepID=UPI00258E0D39|nr:DUF2889 domain-containing protein [Piscinibacter sp.]MCW5666254.1 DUF2889 domain-containing protein [Piscinibacter sp.]
MPLPPPAARREVHQRTIEMQAFARADGLFDVEARLIDRKPFDFVRPSSPQPVPAGVPLHDLWVRLTVDGELTVRAIAAASDVTPWALCCEAEGTLQVLVGERLARGWSAKVKERLRSAAGCTHLMEMLVTMGTTALQGIRGSDPSRRPSPEAKLDSCYAYGRERSVVRMLWPEHHRPPPA